MKMGNTLECVTELILKETPNLGAESLPLSLIHNRILAENVTAKINQPPFNRSPLDGYAAISSDLSGATKDTPAKLQVIDTVYAGGFSHKTLLPGQCVRIFTGAAIPESADCIIMQEDTDYGEEIVCIYKEHKHNDNVVFMGEDFETGCTILPEGTVLNAAALAVLSSSGYGDHDMIHVNRVPKVSVICTGDELTTPGTFPLPEGKIYDSNLTYLLMRLEEMGFECEAGHFADDPTVIREAIEAALTNGDMVITTGGVSVGEKDYLNQVLESLNAKMVFSGVEMKPGSPAVYGLVYGKPVLCLSGNPFAAAATFELLARPALAKLSGNYSLIPSRRTATLTTRFGKKSKGRRLIRSCYNPSTDEVSLPDGHSSGQLLSMVGCNSLVDIPAGSGALEAGSVVNVVLL